MVTFFGWKGDHSLGGKMAAYCRDDLKSPAG